MPTVSVIKRFFRSKEEALADIKNEGFGPFSWLDNPGASFEPHCHANDERLYLIEGTLEFEDVGAHKVFQLQPGDKLLLPARTVHRGRTDGGAIYIVSMKELVHFNDHALPPEEATG